jgi:YebC/PmpR family DNA-binding regulatory protein
MSGHSKWSSIKHQKGVTDARRGQLFTKLGREITVSARQGGPNVDSNFQLRLAIQRARDNNMPLENIERAIKRASGGLETSDLYEMVLEGYGPGGVAILVKALSNNRNRTIQEVRQLLARHGGSMGENGCVSWLFETKGVILVDNENQNTEELALLAIDAGADDVNTTEEYIEIYTQPQDLEEVRKVISVKNKVISTEISEIPKTTMALGEKQSAQVISMIDHLEELDDVQHVFSNAVFSEITLEELSKSN